MSDQDHSLYVSQLLLANQKCIVHYHVPGSAGLSSRSSSLFVCKSFLDGYLELPRVVSWGIEFETAVICLQKFLGWLTRTN